MKSFYITAFLLVLVVSVISTEYTAGNAKDFLVKFGYETPHTVYGSVDESSAIKKAQKYAGIPESGEIDEATLNVMNSKRCGLPDGHDGPARLGSLWPKNKDLRYRFENFSPDIGEAATRSVIRKALKMWSDVTSLTFSENSTTYEISIRFEGGKHKGCRYGFDGRGGVLAHAFFPQDGRVHFDEAETFTDPAKVLLYVESAGLCSYGKGRGRKHYRDRNCLARCNNNHHCSGYSTSAMGDNWCNTYTSVGIATGQADYKCYTKQQEKDVEGIATTAEPETDIPLSCTPKWSGEYICEDVMARKLIIRQLYDHHYTAKECYDACLSEDGSGASPKCLAFNLRTAKGREISRCILLKGGCDKDGDDARAKKATVTHYLMNDCTDASIISEDFINEMADALADVSFEW